MMTRDRVHRASLNACAVVLFTGLAAPAMAGHVSPAQTQGAQERPIELGGSGSSQTFLLVKNLLYCYTGTLGALVHDTAGVVHVLSNNHVLAKENGNLSYGDASADATIIQPGLLDEGPCTLDSGNARNAVADLADYVEILFGKGRNKAENTVDAAIAAVRDGAVTPSGAVLGIGPLGGSIDATLGMPVQKTGRTTAHTFGKVMAVSVSIDVSYDSGTARFVNQLRIRRPCEDAGFSDAGDSGSVIVTAPAPGAEPLAVGLLFAGGGSDTFANPIGPVLTSLGISMVTGADGDTPDALLSDYQAIAGNCPTGGGNSRGGPRGTPPGLTVAKDVAARHSDQIFALPDVVGHGIGADQSGDAVIEIYVARQGRRAAGRLYPSDIEGIPVRVIETGAIRAY
jgi:hypothetical protein